MERILILLTTSLIGFLIALSPAWLPEKVQFYWHIATLTILAIAIIWFSEMLGYFDYELRDHEFALAGLLVLALGVGIGGGIAWLKTSVVIGAVTFFGVVTISLVASITGSLLSAIHCYHHVKKDLVKKSTLVR